MTTDVNFAADACNPFSVPESEPFYIVEFGYGYAYRVYMTRTGEVLWNVLLRYDGSNMDAEPAEKMFDQVLRLDVTLADLWRERCGELGMTEWFCNVNGDYYYIDPWRKRLPSPKCGFGLKKYEAGIHIAMRRAAALGSGPETSTACLTKKSYRRMQPSILRYKSFWRAWASSCLPVMCMCFTM